MDIKQILYSTAADKKIRKLYKKHQSIFTDIRNFIKELQDSNESIGERLQEFPSISLYKARIKNSSSNKGKRGGFRAIYYIETTKGYVNILLFYSKTEQNNVSRQEIEEALRLER